MKNTKRVISILLAVITIFSMCSVMLTASAANYTTNYSSYDPPENSGDYAYWNGKKVVKSSSTSISEIKWMQAALNYCIKNKGLSVSCLLDVDGSFGPKCKTATQAFQRKYGLSVDGSFGPSTIKKMKSVISESVSKYNLIWPTKNTKITGKYGTNGSTRSNGTRYHSGIDIGSAIGDPCYAVADGVVVMCKSSDDAKSTIGGRGRYIVIYHSNGNYSSLYEHLNSCAVKVGDNVKAGQKIGTTGNSGWASSRTHYGAHLHFGLMYGKMTNTGYDLWTVPGKKYNGKTYSNNTFDPDPTYNKNIAYTYK